MKSLEEYKKEIEQDPKARRRLKKLEKEFEQVEESLTDEELVKYGLKPAAPDGHADEVCDAGDVDTKTPAIDKAGASDSSDTADDRDPAAGSDPNSHAVDPNPNSPAVDSVLDVISRKI